LKLEHPFSLTLAYSLEAVCCVNRREVDGARDFGQRTMQLAKEHGFVFFQGSAKFVLGWALAATGNIAEGVRILRECLALWQAIGVGLYRRATLVYIAEIYLKSGQVRQGLDVLAETAETTSPDAERYQEAELCRVTGELWRLADYPEEDVEHCFHQAIHIAQRQQARSLELRATTGLCRLWSAQGKIDEALQQLETIMNWFTEGFDTADFRDASGLALDLRNSRAQLR
jgi:predicted ATPase